MIRTFALLLVLCGAAAPSAAQDNSPTGDLEDSLDRFADEAREFLEGLESEVAPLLRDLGRQLDDLSRYEAPEILPNGDILIRRKPDPVPDLPDLVPEPEDETAPPIDL